VNKQQPSRYVCFPNFPPVAVPFSDHASKRRFSADWPHAQGDPPPPQRPTFLARFDRLVT
jgi:hypothetical protein